jgi:2-polyprenyl-3-methyl-5-hydroxy-6-metoxy-1,4-benzoquinol methylase
MTANNLNTPEYWDRVYRREWESGQVTGGNYSRDYGPIHEAIIRLIPAGSHVLDIACGTGLLSRKIKEQVPASKVMGIDFSPYTIAQNQRRDESLGIEYRCLDLRHALESVRREFDVVAMCEILEHLEEPKKVVGAVMGLLKKRGLFILTCPHDDGIPDPEHLRNWGHDEVFHLLAPYGNTISFVHFPPPYFHVWMLAYLTKQPDPTGTEDAA